MVIAADTPIPPVYDVVFVVEKTANLAAYLETLKTSYILPTLEYFNGGPPDPTDYGNDFSCTLYALVTFHSGDISPSPAASCEYPTTSTHKFLSYLDETNFIGGEAQSYSHISEGLSTALQVFDEIKATRNHSIPSERHCIMVCNSPPYHLPSQESQDYMGFTSEQLASMLGKRGIYLTIISPRKIPALQRLYEESCTTDIPFTPNKDYTVDPRHMVLLHGFQLQERSHSPSLEEDKQTSELIKSSLVSTSGGRVSSPAPATSTEGQFKVPQPTTGLQNITQQPSPQPHALSPLNPQNINQTVAPQPVPQQQPQPQPPPQQQTSIPAQPSGGLPNQQHQQSNQIGMGPPMSQMTRQVPQANPQAKMAISPAMSTVAQQPQNTMVTMANSMAMNQGNGQQVRPGFPKAQIINITPALQQQVKQEPNQMFMNQRTQPQQQQQQQPQVAGGMIANQQRQAVTMVSTQNPMTSTQGMMGAQGMMTTQAGMMTTQAGMMTTQQGMGTTQPGMMTQNIMTSQGMQQHQNKIRMNMPGQQNMASPQVSMTETVPSIVSQPPMSMPQQGISQQQYMQLPGPKAPQMVIPGPGSAPAVGGQGFPGTDPGVADPTRGAQPNNNKKIIWKGSLEYQEKPKPQGPPNTVQQKNTKTLNCCVSIPNNEPDLNARNWPEKLVMQLLPQPMLHELQSLFRNSRQVSFHFSPNDLDALRNLYRIMGTGFAGCVHFSQTANCDIRVLLLLYSSKKKAFVGLIPNDQGAFVQGIRNVLNKVRNKQQTQQVNQPMTASLPMPTPPQQMQTAQGIPSNPQMGGMAMQQTMPITSTTTQAQNKLPLQQDQMGNNCIMMPQGQESSGEESMMNRTITNQPGMDMIQGQQDRTSLQRRIQMLENNLQAAKQKELQYQQQEQAKKAALVAQQRQMMARQQLQMQQQQQQQQRLQMQASQQQQQQQLHHILLNQQNPQGQQTQQQQQQMRQQLLLQQQQQNMRGAAPQSQQGVMGAPQGQQPMQSQAGVMGAPGGQQSMQSQLAMPQPGQNYLEDFNLPDIM